MKLLAVYVLCAVCAGAAALSPTLGSSVLGLMGTKQKVEQVEQRHQQYLSPALTDAARVMHQGVDSNIFQYGLNIHHALVELNIKVGQITGNITSLVSQIEAASDTVNSMSIKNKKVDYTLKKNRVKQLCDESVSKTVSSPGLMDEMKTLLTQHVTVPLKRLQTQITRTSESEIMNYWDIIKRADATLSKTSTIYTTTRKEAEDSKKEAQQAIDSIQRITAVVWDHTKWLEDKCIDIEQELDKSRTEIMEIHGRVQSAADKVDSLINNFVADKSTNDEQLEKSSEFLVKTMKELKQDITNIMNNDRQHIMSPTSWSDVISPENGCVYIYNDKTTGCIYNTTFEMMRNTYKSLSSNASLCIDTVNKYKTRLTELKEKVKEIHSNYTYSAICTSEKYFSFLDSAIETEMKVAGLRGEVHQIRDLAAGINAYADSLFSKSNAEKQVNLNMDEQLNEKVINFFNENQRQANELMMVYMNRNLAIKDEVETLERSPCLEVTSNNNQVGNNGASGAGTQQSRQPSKHHQSRSAAAQSQYVQPGYNYGQYYL